MIITIRKSVILVFLVAFPLAFKAQEALISFTNVSYKGGKNDSLYKYIQQPIYEALSHYDVMKEVPIQIVFKKLNCSMQARPVYSSMFKRKRYRKYHVFVNSSPVNTGFTVVDMSNDQKVGLLGHELAHIRDYVDKSSWNVFIDGIKYVFSKKFRKKYERDTDSRAIANGLGRQLGVFSNFLDNYPNINEKYKKRLDRFYLSTQEIKKAQKKKKAKGFK